MKLLEILTNHAVPGRWRG